MEHLPHIPTPASERWRKFRFQLLPVLVFLTTLTAVYYLWKGQASQATIVGEIVSHQAHVSSSQAGTLISLLVAPFQQVSAGDPIAQIRPSDPRVSLALIQAEIDLLRAGTEPILEDRRNALDYERLRVEWLLQRIQLATAQVNLQRAENEFQRMERLFKANLVSDADYDLALKAKEALRVEVEEKTKFVDEIQKSLERLNAPYQLVGTGSSESSESPLRAAISAQERKLELAETRLTPVTLIAPIDGMVSTVYRQAGENVVEGELIVTIRALDSDRIVGYIRQPLPSELQTGMPVEIRTRSHKLQIASGQLLEIGAQMEPITNFALLRPGLSFELGLPIQVSKPPQLKARPGELVDLTILPPRGGKHMPPVSQN